MADIIFVQDFETFNGYPYLEGIPNVCANEPPYLDSYYIQDFKNLIYNGCININIIFRFNYKQKE